MIFGTQIHQLKNSAFTLPWPPGVFIYLFISIVIIGTIPLGQFPKNFHKFHYFNFILKHQLPTASAYSPNSVPKHLAPTWSLSRYLRNKARFRRDIFCYLFLTCLLSLQFEASSVRLIFCLTFLASHGAFSEAGKLGCASKYLHRQ